MLKRIYLGIDIGGTNIKLAAVNGEGRILARTVVETRPRDDPDEAFGRIHSALGSVLKKRETLAAVGIGCAGLVDSNKGELRAAPNLPAWRNTPIGRIAKRHFKTTIFVDNDANAAAYGEHVRGAGRGARMFVCITLGTGVGGGIVHEGRLLRGAANHAGEIGHMTICEDGPPCRCGNRGCVEAYVGSYALVKSAREKLKKNKGKILTRWMSETGFVLTPKLIADAARRGDRVAREVLEQAGRHLGTACASIVNIFNPEVIALLGGVSGAYDIIHPVLEREMFRRAFEESASRVKITRGRLGNDAATIGAALMARDALASMGTG